MSLKTYAENTLCTIPESGNRTSLLLSFDHLVIGSVRFSTIMSVRSTIQNKVVVFFEISINLYQNLSSQQSQYQTLGNLKGCTQFPI